jgi:hypothetical protein
MSVTQKPGCRPLAKIWEEECVRPLRTGAKLGWHGPGQLRCTRAGGNNVILAAILALPLIGPSPIYSSTLGRTHRSAPALPRADQTGAPAWRATPYRATPRGKTESRRKDLLTVSGQVSCPPRAVSWPGLASLPNLWRARPAQNLTMRERQGGALELQASGEKGDAISADDCTGSEAAGSTS